MTKQDDAALARWDAYWQHGFLTSCADAFDGNYGGSIARYWHDAFASLERADSWDAIKGKDLDYVHLFTDSADTVDVATPALRKRIRQNGMIWVSWPKKASKVPTDVTEDTIRNRALKDVLVDVKVCAVDEIWSGLKLVIRKELRT